MEFKHVCKICDRKFVNGKSMGGHMRSHFVKLEVQPKPSSPNPSELLNAPNPSELLKAPKTITSASRADSASGILNPNSGYALGSRAHFASPPSSFSAMGLGVRASARKRSKRIHSQLKGMESARLNAPPTLNPQNGNFSSPYELVTVEDAALCLMMLSNDKWPEGVPHPKVTTILSDSDVTPKDNEDLGADKDDDDNSSESMDLNMFGHRCETCKKVFKSYQALGGHMRNHKRPLTLPALAVEKREFPCEICLKVFPSGQALGGHKKVHLATQKKLAVGNPLPKNKLPVIEVGSDSESDSGFRFASLSTSDADDETSSDTYYNAE